MNPVSSLSLILKERALKMLNKKNRRLKPFFLFLGLATAVSAGQIRPPVKAEETRGESWQRRLALSAASPFRNLHWKSLGPRFQGGRVEAIDAVPGTGTIYVGFGAGNVWKTVNHGLTWTPIFEDQPTFTIGDLAISPSHPQILYVGTGENLMARSSFAGWGVFKSIDGGQTWTHLGLEDTHHIGRVVVHPKNPDIVYVAALGHLYSFNKERGVFKTEDGGKTWKNVLFIDEKTGAADVVLDLSDPETVYASTNEHDRKAWNNVEHGPGSGIYKSTDGGRSWKRLMNGLPAGPYLGRIGLAVAPSRPEVVYAFLSNQTPVEVATKEGKRTSPIGPEVYRSDDKGETWRKCPMKNDRLRMGFYADIFVSPENPDVFYALGQNLMTSRDGGRTFENIHGRILHLYSHPSPALHLDQHDLWIDPVDPNRLILGNDGGVYQSTDRGLTWLHLNNIPAGEFYALSLDDADPYFIYGGTQDNAAHFGPADRLPVDGIDDPWRYVWIDLWGGGDSYVTAVDPSDPNVIYFEQQFGDFQRKNVKTGELKRIRPQVKKEDPPLRFNWMSPFIVSRHNPLTVYFGANMLFKSLDRGDHWICISPDLTTKPGPDRQGNVPYGTITTISESPRQPGLLYVGTDDGRVWVTRNDGVVWDDIGAGLPNKWISRVEASAHTTGGVYVALTGYREDDFRTYLFKSKDFGKTWQPIASNLPSEQVNVIREDPQKSGVLYIGTDQGGVYASFDDGASWQSLCADLPTTPVHDIAVQGRERELVIATHGRSVFKLDIAPVLEFTLEVAAKDAHLFSIRAARRPQARDYGNDWALETRKTAVFHYFLKDKQDVTIRIYGEKDSPVQTLAGPGEPGLNAAEWDLVLDGETQTVSLPQAARMAAAGTYRLEIEAGPVKLSGTFRVDAPAQPKVGRPR
jgi:photosystem II stability/assembly factor-like uncharacterized protein